MDIDTATAVRVRLETALRGLTAAHDVAVLGPDPDLPLTVSIATLIEETKAAVARIKGDGTYQWPHWIRLSSDHRL